MSSLGTTTPLNYHRSSAPDTRNKPLTGQKPKLFSSASMHQPRLPKRPSRMSMYSQTPLSGIDNRQKPASTTDLLSGTTKAAPPVLSLSSSAATTISPPVPVRTGATAPSTGASSSIAQLSRIVAASSGMAGSSSVDAAKQESTTKILDEVHLLSKQAGESSESVDSASLLSKRKKTTNMLSAWLKQKRPTLNQLQAQGLLSTDGSITPINKSSMKKGVIGMNLEELIECLPDRDIPIIVDQCVTYLQKCAMKLSGIFRVSPNNAELKRLQKAYKYPTDVVDLSKKVKDPHSVAGLLKLWLAQLPEPLFSFTLYDPFMDLFSGKISDRSVIAKHAKALLASQSRERRLIVDFLFEFLLQLSKYSEKNKMTPNNLGIVFGPNLIRPKQQTQDTMLNRTNVEVVQFLIEEYSNIWC
eukprot:CAMPEP_0201551566 /NCGR_PEP_ID=MMETSP0173_2-20130828/7724_1 /ASSEMBLY_ACC=CAM_ASM_000268 /TAXON_ID=218659 /ORGANISM="Vexillifera sp., Strain DIVA3 564/2" /LENGTH=413 /DNA_ID=CAMNT_0047961857 /DNA_START=45 /DNA_END=1286 /DNA_ORIENTATION=+